MYGNKHWCQPNNNTRIQFREILRANYETSREQKSNYINTLGLISETITSKIGQEYPKYE